MNIRAKLTLRFSIIVASILVLFSLSVYVLSDIYRQEEFYARLESRAITTARLLVKVKEVDMNLLRVIDRNSIHALFEEKILVFNYKDSLLYSSLDDFPINYDTKLLDQIRQKNKIEYTENDREVVGIHFKETEGDVIVISSAFDRYGRSKLQNLGRVLLIGLFLGMGIIMLTGRIFVQQALRPLVRLNTEIANVSAGNLDQRVFEGDKHDEFAQLTENFNRMLERLQQAFAIQQHFVSNASHELRNPLAALSSQIQATLGKPRSTEEYQNVLKSLFEDTRSLADLTNSLLVLAQSGIEQQRAFFQLLRVDEVIFSAQTEISKAFPHYRFQIGYTEWPDDDDALKILGNEQLLKTAFQNLIDNACKFSPDHTVRVSVSFPAQKTIEICFSDQGPGISPNEQEKIFDPFYRSADTPSTVKGYGIGLSLCRRIIQLHKGTLRLNSNGNTGSCFVVTFNAHP